MNPIAWPGPPFLFFYGGVAAVVVLALYWHARGAGEARANVSFMTSDPYRIALLRAGEHEAIRVAVFNLVDRGLLQLRPDGTLATARKDAESLVRRKLDRVLLATCLTPTTPNALLRHRAARQEVSSYAEDLRRERLLHANEARLAQVALLAAGILLLGGLAFAKVSHALVHGRTNVIFLCVLAALACFLAAKLGLHRTTVAGDGMLADLRTLTKRLLDRAETLKPRGESNEALLVASVYGIWALPHGAFPFAEMLYPRPKADGSGDGGGSSGSDGGSSDGGSGCGGGCGGCGSD